MSLHLVAILEMKVVGLRMVSQVDMLTVVMYMYFVPGY